MGGGSNDKAAKQAERNEKERQAQIAESTGRINSIFTDPRRTGQYDKLAQDTTAYMTEDLNRQKADTDRALKFSLARSGQTGGSVMADQTKNVGQTYLRGVLEAQRRGAAAGADLRSADEQARANLLLAAQSGTDATTATSQGLSQLQSNLDTARAGANAQGMGDMFSQFSDFYRKSQDEAARRRGEKYAYNTIYQPGFGYGGN